MGNKNVVVRLWVRMLYLAMSFFIECTPGAASAPHDKSAAAMVDDEGTADLLRGGSCS